MQLLATLINKIGMGHNLVIELVNAARLRMQTQGEFSRFMITDMVEELIDEFMRDGLITDDEDVAVLKTAVVRRLEEYIT